jgi:hypothetical protein
MSQKTSSHSINQPQFTIDAAYAQAVDHFNAERYTESDKFCTSIIKASPNHIDAINLLGIIAQKINRHDLAIVQFQCAIDIDSSITTLHYNKGLSFAQLGQIKEAKTAFRQALQIDPNQDNVIKALVGLEMHGEGFRRVLERFHEYLKPTTYLELGISKGVSLALAQKPTIAVGVDPNPNIECTFSAETKIFQMESDHFFLEHKLSNILGGHPLDFVFIDGLHIFEQILKDFINVEKNATSKTIVVLHDSLPIDPITSASTRVSNFWTGDVWIIVPSLFKYRPDLKVFTILAPPSGLTVITRLDSASTVLQDNFQNIVDEFKQFSFDDFERVRDEQFKMMNNDWQTIKDHLFDGFDLV